MAASVPATGQRASGSRTSAKPWGDGFSADGLPALARVADLGALDPDEMAALHPALAARGAPALAPPLAARFSEASAVRDARLSFLRHVGPLHPRHADWFAGGAARLAIPRWLGTGPASPVALAREAALCGAFGDLARAARSGTLPPYDPAIEALSAFCSGIHPGYAWAESACAPARGYTAAWLGIVCRGRSAYMPPAVAEHLADGEGLLDPDLVALAGEALLRRMSGAARRRIDGEDRPCGLAPGSHLTEMFTAATA